MLHTQTGKNRCARLIVPPLAGQACSEQDLTYGEVLFILSQPARAQIWRTLTRFSSAWVCNVRVYPLSILLASAHPETAFMGVILRSPAEAGRRRIS